MKTLLLLATFLTGLSVKGQDSLDKAVSTAICDCVEKIQNLSMDGFLTCFQQSAEKNSTLILKEAKALYGDTSYESGRKFGQYLYSRISVSMIYDCTPYYKLMDSLRNSSMPKIDRDSAKNELDKLNKIDPGNWNSDFFTKRGLILFQISDLKNAVLDFENAIKQNQNALQSIFFKAWTLELLRDYDGAFSLYSHLATLTNRNEFNIFAAIAKRKKNGL